MVFAPVLFPTFSFPNGVTQLKEKGLQECISRLVGA